MSITVGKDHKMDRFFIEIALAFSKLSHCIRVKVGAVIVRDGRIISTGYNGTPPGFINCDDYFADKAQYDITRMRYTFDHITREEHAAFSKNEIHAEMNALIFAAKNGTKVDGSTIYTSVSPCIDCAKAIVASGIKRVVYSEKYDRDQTGIDFLTSCGVDVCQI